MDPIRGQTFNAPPPVNVGGAEPELRKPAATPKTGGAGKPGEGGKQSFADVWNRIQSDMGAKPEKPRQIKKSLDKDDFMRIMISQMKHQDPTKPFDTEKLGQEIAQIAQLEQMSNVSQALKKLGNQHKPLERLTMTNLIGKTVVIDQNRFPHTKGDNQTVNFNLPADAKEVKLALVSQAGEVVMEKSLGPKAAGAQSFVWDGKKANTIEAESGDYLIRVEAVGKDDKPLATNALSRSKIIGVALQGEDPVFIVGDANSNVKVKLENVTQIEDAGDVALPPGLAAKMGMGAAPTPATAEGAEGTAAAPANPFTPVKSGGGNFIKFEPGVGSETVSAKQLPADAAKALASYQAQQAAAKSAEAAADEQGAGEEKGFPNGMSVYNKSSKEGGE
ncbi:MAG: flagellar hook assembly protein FlgD [Bacteriovoracia bacterium]